MEVKGDTKVRMIPRIELEIKKLQAHLTEPEHKFNTDVPAEEEEEIRLPEVFLEPLQASFGKPKPPEQQLQWFQEVKREELEELYEEHGQSIASLSRRVVKAGKELHTAWSVPRGAAALCTTARYAKLLANKNQDVFYSVFDFEEEHFWEIIAICVTMLVTAFDDVRRNQSGFFAKLFRTVLVLPMRPGLRTAWERKVTLANLRSTMFVQSPGTEAITEKSDAQLVKEIENAKETKHTTFNMYQIRGAEKLVFFQLYNSARKNMPEQKPNADSTKKSSAKTKPQEPNCATIAQGMVYRNARECVSFMQANKGRLSGELVEDDEPVCGEKRTADKAGLHGKDSSRTPQDPDVPLSEPSQLAVVLSAKMEQLQGLLGQVRVAGQEELRQATSAKLENLLRDLKSSTPPKEDAEESNGDEEGYGRST